MKKNITICVAIIVALVFSGCTKDAQNEKLREFLHIYGNKTAEEAYVSTRQVKPFFDFHREITKVEILDHKTESSSVTMVKYHNVKAKIYYRLTDRYGEHRHDTNLLRFLSLVIEEDLGGQMVVDSFMSHEVAVVGDDENMMKQMYAENFANGLKLISSNN